MLLPFITHLQPPSSHQIIVYKEHTTAGWCLEKKAIKMVRRHHMPSHTWLCFAATLATKAISVQTDQLAAILQMQHEFLIYMNPPRPKACALLIRRFSARWWLAVISSTLLGVSCAAKSGLAPQLAARWKWSVARRCSWSAFIRDTKCFENCNNFNIFFNQFFFCLLISFYSGATPSRSPLWHAHVYAEFTVYT